MLGLFLKYCIVAKSFISTGKLDLAPQQEQFRPLTGNQIVQSLQSSQHSAQLSWQSSGQGSKQKMAYLQQFGQDIMRHPLYQIIPAQAPNFLLCS